MRAPGNSGPIPESTWSDRAGDDQTAMVAQMPPRSATPAKAPVSQVIPMAISAHHFRFPRVRAQNEPATRDLHRPGEVMAVSRQAPLAVEGEVHVPVRRVRPPFAYHHRWSSFTFWGGRKDCP
jgi:hypothetical protein